MSIEKNCIVNNRATPLKYWRYEGLASLQDHINPATGEKQKVAIVLLGGYVNADFRQQAKEHKRGPDHVIDFMIRNWKERVQEARPATLEEKKFHNPGFRVYEEITEVVNEKVEEDGEEKVVSKEVKRQVEREWTDEEWDAYQFDIVTRDEWVAHNDFDKYSAAIGTDNEAAVAYEIFKTNEHSQHFFDGAKDV